MVITFIASLPAVQSAIKIGQDGARVQLDVPESELANMLHLVNCRNKALKVTIEPTEREYDYPEDWMSETNSGTVPKTSNG